MKRPAALFFVVILLFSSLFSCSTTGNMHTPCRDVVVAMTAVEIGLPTGRYYSITSSEGDKEYISHSLISSIFGNGTLPAVTADWLDCALFLSLKDSPCEFVVVLCTCRDAAEDTAALFHSRLDAIKITKTAPEYSQMIENASVTITGNYAILIISKDPTTALRAAKRAIRK